MNMKTINETEDATQASPTFTQLCLNSCRKLISGLNEAREAIADEYRQTLAAHKHLVHLALNEAEAMAWETEFPFLVFPTLAREKVQALADWQAHQQTVGAFAQAA